MKSNFGKLLKYYFWYSVITIAAVSVRDTIDSSPESTIISHVFDFPNMTVRLANMIRSCYTTMTIALFVSAMVITSIGIVDSISKFVWASVSLKKKLKNS